MIGVTGRRLRGGRGTLPIVFTLALAALNARDAVALQRSSSGALVAPAASSAITVTLGTPQVIALAGVSQAITLDEAICAVELVAGGIRVTGLLRGDAVLLAWQGETRLTLLIHVVPAPPPVVPRVASEAEQLAVGRGSAASAVQRSSAAGGRGVYDFQHDLDWTQQLGARRLAVRLQGRDSSRPGAPLVLTNLALQYMNATTAVTLADVSLPINGGTQARIPGYVSMNTYGFRGASVEHTTDQTTLGLFGGTSLPTDYRRWFGSRGIAGLTLTRRVTPSLLLYGTTAGVRVPLAQTAANASSLFQTAGVTYQSGARWAAQLTSGASNRGAHVDGAIVINGDRADLRVSGVSSSPAFPLNQLQLLSAGGRSAQASASWRATPRLSAALSYSHSETRASALVPAADGRSDYVSPSVSVILARGQSLVVTAARSRTRGGGDAETTYQRADTGWTAELGRVTNAAQASVTRIADRSGLTSGAQFGLRDALNVRVPHGSLSVTWQQTQADPSLASRLKQQIGRLSTDLQELFLRDPAGFVQSNALPPDVRELLTSLRTADAQVSLGGDFAIGARLNVNASYGLLRSDTGRARGQTRLFTYSLAWHVSPTVQIRSSIADTFALVPGQTALARSSTFYVGLARTLNGTPRWLAGAGHDQEVTGHVFVDRNVSGVYDRGEPGLAGIRVTLDTGRVAITDSTGAFRFAQLSPGTYRVAIATDQLQGPVRLTTMASSTVDLFDRRTADVGFGVVNFSRLMGTVFNDYELSGRHEADSPGLQRVQVIVADDEGFERRVSTDAGGSFELVDLPPGDYRVSVDPQTMPADFVRMPTSATVTIEPVQSRVVDVPVRAMRSVGGHVFLQQTPKGPSDTPALVPVRGVIVSAGRVQSTTDETGRFMLRNLPAGDVQVTLKPIAPMPEGLVSPTGRLRLPKDPIRVDDATIVISNAALLAYLQGEQ